VLFPALRAVLTEATSIPAKSLAQVH